MAGKKATKPNLKIGQIAKALKKNNGLITPTAELFGVSYQAIQQRVKASPLLQKIVNDVADKVTDRAENQLFKQINDGNMTAVIFYLKTKGRARGYIEKRETELSMDPHKPVKFVIEFIKPSIKHENTTTRKITQSNPKAKKI